MINRKYEVKPHHDWLEKILSLAETLVITRGKSRRSSAWLERRPGKAEVPGSNPGGGFTQSVLYMPSRVHRCYGFIILPGAELVVLVFINSR